VKYQSQLPWSRKVIEYKTFEKVDATRMEFLDSPCQALPSYGVPLIFTTTKLTDYIECSLVNDVHL
jgi:hypothetical protein